MSDPWLVDVEAYVLGALGEPERSAFEEHLRSCAACRAAVDEVGPMPALLDLVPPDLIGALAAQDPVTAAVPGPPTEQVPDSVLAGLLWSVRRDALRRRRRVVGAALAVAAVVVLALVVPASPLSLVHRAQPAPVEVLALVAQGPAPVAASVALESVPWGTRIDVSCQDASAAGGASAGGAQYDRRSQFALVVVTDDGTSEQVATWAGVPGATITVPAATGHRLAEIASIELVDGSGKVLLSADR